MPFEEALYFEFQYYLQSGLTKAHKQNTVRQKQLRLCPSGRAVVEGSVHHHGSRPLVCHLLPGAATWDHTLIHSYVTLDILFKTTESQFFYLQKKSNKIIHFVDSKF